MKVLHGRKCPKCNGIGVLRHSGGTQITHYCECEKCGLRTRDYKSSTDAIYSWNNDSEAYFFYRNE